MTNDLGIEDKQDLPAQETEAREITDSNPTEVAPEEVVEEPVVAEAPDDDPGDEQEIDETEDGVLPQTETVSKEEQEPEQMEAAEGETPSAELDETLVEAAAGDESEAVEAAAPPADEPVEPAEGETQVAVETIQEEEDGRLWYVVHCYSGYENKVRHNLEQRIETMGMKDRIFDVVVPTEEEIEVKNGKRKTVERRVFPGYILVQMIMTEESWYVVRNTPGVTGFVGMGNEPTPLRPEEVSQIIKRMEAEAPRIKVTYKTGQKVRIIDGPFNDFIGTVDEIDMERAKVRVMVSFFGRETPVELDFLQVEKA
jgi:transcriptional antiterminator NusG